VTEDRATKKKDNKMPQWKKREKKMNKKTQL
jgi:hypothetical protein